MKKIAVLLVAVFGALFLTPIKGVANAEEMVVSNSWFKSEYYSILSSDLLIDRTAGTKGEKEFALYLQDKMTELGYLANGSDSENASFEYFEFVSSIDKQTKRSQNVKFIKKGSDSSKKVIVGTSYDNAFGFADSSNALNIIGADASLNNVLVVLSIANQLKDVILPFDLEFVFFGAGYHNMAGSKFYTLGIDQNEKENILLALNIDDLSENILYFYDAENDTNQGKYAKKTLGESSLNIKKYKAGTSVIFSSCEIYPFTHRALISDNLSFMQSGVRTLSLLSVSKNGYFDNEYCRLVKNERFEGGYPEYLDRAAELSVQLSNMLSGQDFASSMVGNKKVSSFWTDKKYALFVFMILLVVIVLTYWFIHDRFLKQTKKKYSLGDATKLLGEKIDKEIDKSNNPELIAHRGEIRSIFEENLKQKIQDNKQKKNDPSEEDE